MSVPVDMHAVTVTAYSTHMNRHAHIHTSQNAYRHTL